MEVRNVNKVNNFYDIQIKTKDDDNAVIVNGSLEKDNVRVNMRASIPLSRKIQELLCSGEADETTIISVLEMVLEKLKNG